MSQHFYGSIEGKGSSPVHAAGTKDSGIQGHIRGWSVGARVSVNYDEGRGRDVVTIYATTGSSDQGNDQIIARFDAETLKLCDTCANRMEGGGCEHGHPNPITCQADKPGDFVPIAEAVQ